MSAAREVSFPQGDTPALQRMGSSLRELVRTLIASGAFLLRPGLSDIIVPRSATDMPALKWGEFNRVLLSVSASVQLPRISSPWVGVPLLLAKLSSAGTLTLSPSGLGLNRRTAPTINEAASVAVGDPGLYTLVTDGQNWFAGKAVP